MRKTLDDSYRLYENRIGFGRVPALILVDFVQAYFESTCELYANVDDALTNALKLREAAQAKGVLVILTNVVYQAGGADGGRFFQKARPLRSFIAGNPLGNWPARLQPLPSELVISKQYPSAFFGTSLASTLASHNIDTLLITGLTTSGCVRATCVDACSYGFIPIIVREAVGDRHNAPHEANLFDMNAKYGDVVSLAEVMAFLETLERQQ